LGGRCGKQVFEILTCNHHVPVYRIKLPTEGIKLPTEGIKLPTEGLVQSQGPAQTLVCNMRIIIRNIFIFDNWFVATNWAKVTNFNSIPLGAFQDDVENLWLTNVKC
jgi:hypothetical protein